MDESLLARLDERSRAQSDTIGRLERTLDTLTRLIEKRERELEERIEKSDEALMKQVEAIVVRIAALENFRSYLKPGIVILGALAVALAVQVGGQVMASSFSYARPPQAFPQLKPPTNGSQELQR